MTKIAILIFLLIVAWLSLRSLEPRTLYYPDRVLIAKPSVYRLVYEEVELSTEDRVKIHGWWIPATRPGGPVPTILYCHGNAGNISNRLDKLAKFHALGVNVLIFDYRGYGRSEGHPSELGTYQDADAAYGWLVNAKSIAPGQVVFYGESLGCAVALEMAGHHSGAGLILESPFTSTVAMAKRIFPWMPAKWIVRYRYDNLSKIPKIKMPLLILHSPQDEIVPFEMGKQLFSAAPEPKRFVELEGGHNDGYIDTGEKYTETVKEFITAVFVKRPISEGLR